MSSSSSSSRQSLLLMGAPFVPLDLTGLPLIHALSALSSDILTSPSSIPPLHRASRRSLLAKIRTLLLLFDSLSESPSPNITAADVCLRELYILLHRARSLLHHLSASSRLYLLLRNPSLSAHFRHLTLDLSTLLDLFPLDAFSLPSDLKDHLRLLRRRCRNHSLLIDHTDDELLRQQLLSLIDSLSHGQIPSQSVLRTIFLRRLGIRDASALRFETDFLEEIVLDGVADDPTIIGGVIALARYSRFLFFGCQPAGTYHHLKRTPSGISSEMAAIPKDFCCPISLEMMRDPVVTASGMTYDRDSISRWMEEGNSTCPNSGLTLPNADLVPNLALRSVIYQWCAARGVPYDSRNANHAAAEAAADAPAAVEANRASAVILIHELSIGSEESKIVAAHELRLLARRGNGNRDSIAEAGAIPLLRGLLCSSNPAAQEEAVTAFLNLSILEKNKVMIVEEEGCLESIVRVVHRGWTTEATENAAATLFSLSVIHDYKKRIAGEPGAVEALVGLLKDGTTRGQKDAATALFNLATHEESCDRMVEAGAVPALVRALETEGAAEEAAAALALLVRRRRAVAEEDGVVAGLVGLMRMGGPRGKEHAVAALHEMCRMGGVGMARRVARAPAVGGMVQGILVSGTKRARRKAAALARMCDRAAPEMVAAFGGGWAIGYAFASSSSGGDESSVSAIPVL